MMVTVPSGATFIRHEAGRCCGLRGLALASGLRLETNENSAGTEALL